MSNNKLKKVSLTTAAIGLMAGTANAAESEAVDELIAKIKDKSDKVRAEAWLNAGEVGASAVKPLATVMRDKELEVARAAMGGLRLNIGQARRLRRRCRVHFTQFPKLNVLARLFAGP